MISQTPVSYNYPNYGNPHVTQARWKDQQYGAAFYVFTRCTSAFNYVTARGIEKEALLNASSAWGSGEQILVRVALELFDLGCVRENGYDDATVGDIATRLDAMNFRVVVNAMHIIRGRVRIEDLMP